MRLHDMLEYHAREQPEVSAVRDSTRAMTYRELGELADSFADALVDAGIRSGDRYGALATNCLEYFAFYLGAAKVGAVTVPLNQRLAPPEWAHLLEDAGCGLVVGRGELVSALDGVRDQLRSVDTFVALGTSQPGWEDWSAWLDAAPSRPPSAEPIRPEDPVVQMYTSGTTGRPKGAVLSHGSVTASLVQGLGAFSDLTRGCVHIVAPLSHMGSTANGLLHLLDGGSVYVQEDFDPPEVVRILDEEGVNRSVLVPAMIQALLVHVPDVADRQYRDLASIGYGASPIAPETLRRAMEVFGCDFFQGFGQTEASGSVTYLTHADHRRAAAGAEHLLQSAGRPAMGTEVRVVDADGRDCVPGEVGEIVVRGPQLMSEYWNLPEETAEALRGGWLHMGDAGTFDEEGYLYVKDRIKDMIVTGGENVYPAEVEKVLFGHVAVADVAVIGVPDERWGEAVKACVVLREGADVGEADLLAFCRGRIAGFKVPKSVDFVDALPRNASGKVRKVELRRPYWQGHDRSVS